MLRKRLRLLLASAGLLFLGSPALPVVAQDLEFEQVGDQPIDAAQLQFDSAASLWAIEVSALWRLEPAQNWEEIGSDSGHYLLVLSPDTLFRGTTAGSHRSVDGGKNFDFVYEEGGDFFASDLSGSNNGVILIGAHGGSGIAYSTDRGATFTEATFTVSASSTPFLESAVEIPDGPAAGRLVAGVFGGVVISEDGGQTWSPSSLFQDARFWVQRVVIGTDPATGNRRLYLTLADAQLPDVQFYFSDDDGLTWTDVPGLPDVYLFVFVPQGEGFLLAVERGYDVVTERIPLWQSEDGGQSWTFAGELPAKPNGNGISTDDMLIGPNGHVYIGVNRSGPEHEWVYRTTEPVVVANEPEAPPPPTAGRLIVYPNPATDQLTVEANGSDEVVVLYDLLGRAVSRASLSSGKASLDVSRLAAGVYVVQVGTLTQHVTLVK